jgi:two-component system phosphate regulon sensor histidine kinase PhoR
LKYSITTYIVIAFVSFFILASVQLYLVSNTYELKNERYHFSEKSAIRESYSQSVMYDVMYPGGTKVFDSVIAAHKPTLDQLYKTNRSQFDIYKQQVAAALFSALRQKESILSVLTRFKKEKKIKDSLEYALMVQFVNIPVGDVSNMNIYSKDDISQFIDKNIQEPNGIRIGGTLKHMDNQNMIVQLTVGDATKFISKIIYSLHVERVNRTQTILGQMGLTLVLSLSSVLIVVLLFFVTFRNWIRQKKLSEMKSDFINNITHEFHTPLTAINVANKSLQNEKIIEKKENIKLLTDVIQRQSDRLKMLFEQVLNIVSMNKVALQKKEHSVNHLLDEILLDYRLNLTDKKVNLLFDQRAVEDRVPLDQFHFTTLLINILDNAVKYNNKEVKEITVSTVSDKNSVQIVIQDNGMGMEPETSKHIFEKFYRAPNGNGQSTPGLGLGLYYVKQSIEAHQWQIQVESIYGTGSIFTIDIPFQHEGV